MANKTARIVLDLSRFDAAPLVAFIATKETDYGTETDGRLSQKRGADRVDQRIEAQAMDARVVMAIAPAAHRIFQIVFAQERRPFMAGKLGTLIGMDKQARLGLSTPNRQEQSLYGKF